MSPQRRRSSPARLRAASQRNAFQTRWGFSLHREAPVTCRQLSRGEAAMVERADDPGVTPEQILALGLGFWGSKTLLSAVELGVFTELADGPVGAENLVQKLGLHQRS